MHMLLNWMRSIVQVFARERKVKSYVQNPGVDLGQNVAKSRKIRAIPTICLKVEKAFRERNNFYNGHDKSSGSKVKPRNLFQMFHLSGKELKLITESIHRQIKIGPGTK